MHESALARDLWDRIRVHAESNKLAAILSCSRCGTRRIGDMDETLSCGKCGSRDFEIIAGKDVYVREIEGE